MSEEEYHIPASQRFEAILLNPLPASDKYTRCLSGIALSRALPPAVFMHIGAAY